MRSQGTEGEAGPTRGVGAARSGLARATGALEEQAVTRLGRLGYSPPRLAEVERELLWWAWARAGAAASRRPLLRGWGLAWGSAGYVEAVPAEVPAAGEGQVTLRVEASAISPGTERAQYLHLPNTAVGILGRPGYSGAGRVIRVGTGVEGLSPGDRAAITGAPHASLATVPASSAYPVPAGVPLEAAALVQLGIIAGHGVASAGLVAGQPFCVVGAGLVGALALRLGAAMGGEPAAVVARSRAKEAAARAGGAGSFLVAGPDDGAIAGLRAPVVIEATGDPAGIPVAMAAAGPGGRVVLLGSPRGVTPDLDLRLMRERRLEIVGAHVDTIEAVEAREAAGPVGEAGGRAAGDAGKRAAGEEGAAPPGGGARRRLGEAFLAALASGLEVADLVGESVDPREAALFYRRLAGDPAIVGAHLDWSCLPPAERARPGHLLRVPDVGARGVTPDHRPLRPRAGPSRPGLRAPGPDGPGSAAARGPFGPADPFAGASGRLRVGMLGCGDIAGRNASAIAAAPNVTLSACYDTEARLADDLARRFGGEAVRSVESLVGHPAVDAVLVCVPHHLHGPLTAQALRAGRHVIVEKPMAETLAAAAAMADDAARAGSVLSVCFPQRYEPAVAIARRLVEAGVLGEPCGASVTLYLDKPPAYWIGGFSGRSRSTWRSSRRQAGGGVLVMNLSHHLDLLHHLLGLEVASVSATAGATDQAMEIEDAVSVGLTFANGAVGSLTGGSAVRGSDASLLRVWGRDGHIIVEPAPRVFTLKAVDGLRPARWHTFGRLPVVNSRAVYLSRLATAIHQGLPPDVGADRGLAVQAVIEAAYRSAETGVAVRPAALLAEVGAGRLPTPSWMGAP